MCNAATSRLTPEELQTPRDQIESKAQPVATRVREIAGLSHHAPLLFGRGSSEPTDVLLKFCRSVMLPYVRFKQPASKI